MITIEHTRAEGTIVHGTDRGDGTAEILKTHGFRFSRALGAWYVRGSRDQRARTYTINAARDALQVAGFDVEVKVDDVEHRDVAAVEAEKAGRVADRADALAAKEVRVRDQAREFGRRSDALNENIPLGQPILIGHHSEQRHRNLLDKSWRLLGKAVEGLKEADRLEAAADAAANWERYRNDVPTTLRRIAGFEAELRKLDRYIGRLTVIGQETAERRDELARKIQYWREVVAQAEAAGVKVWRPDDFAKGDFVLFHSTWFEVVRVNAKTLTIPAMLSRGPIVHATGDRLSWNDGVPYDKVRGRKSAAEIAELEAKAATS